jgi:hypothetical protein
MEHRMLRHKATIQGARVAFGFSGITDEDEAAATPGFAGAKDVTPKTAARATPLDPFASLPEVPAPAEETASVVEAQVVEPAPEDAEPTEAEMLANDIIEDVKTSDTPSLASYVEQADKQLSGEPQQKVKKGIVARAKVLGVKWNKEKGGFEA